MNNRLETYYKINRILSKINIILFNFRNRDINHKKFKKELKKCLIEVEKKINS